MTLFPADITDFEGVNAYNVADMLKTFFRDLPECLLTNKLSETFRSIYTREYWQHIRNHLDIITMTSSVGGS